MKILIAGVNGNIGYYIYSRLKKKHSITSIGRKTGKVKQNFIRLDLTEKKNTIKFAEHCDYFEVLIFLVGLAHKKGLKKEFEDFEMTNCQTLKNLLSSLKKNNKTPKKIIFASTVSIYGEKKDCEEYLENKSPKPFSPYASTKLNAEEYLKKNYKSKYWILRFAPVYSESFKLNINRRTMFGGNFYKVGKISKKLSLCNIENIGLSVVGILKSQIPSDVYNISDKKEYKYEDLLEYQKAKKIVIIPYFMIEIIFMFGILINNTFLKENSIKLLTNNIFPSSKINNYISLSFSLNKS